LRLARCTKADRKAMARTSTESPRNANVSDAIGGGVDAGEALA
jgi:hypothetical protein